MSEQSATPFPPLRHYTDDDVWALAKDLQDLYDQVMSLPWDEKLAAECDGHTQQEFAFFCIARPILSGVANGIRKRDSTLMSMVRRVLGDRVER